MSGITIDWRYTIDLLCVEMPAQLILDRSDPEVAAILDQWQEGGQYRIELTVTQGPTTGTETAFQVDGITDYGDAMAPEETGEEAGEPPKGSRPPEALMVLIGQKKATGKPGGGRS